MELLTFTDVRGFCPLPTLKASNGKWDSWMLKVPRLARVFHNVPNRKVVLILILAP